MTDDLHSLRRRFDEEIVNAHDLVAIPKWFAADFVDHVEIPGMPTGIGGVVARHQMLFTAMPDIHIAIETVIVERDTTAARFAIGGTDTGGFMGMPATGKSVRVTGMDFMRWRDGLVVEHWGELDMLALMQQLGVIPG
jgi:predicted ester cyclase